MSLYNSKELQSTSFTQQSSKIRNNSAIMNLSKMTRTTTYTEPSTPSFSQGNMTGKLSRLSEKLAFLRSELELESMKVKVYELLFRKLIKHANILKKY